MNLFIILVFVTTIVSYVLGAGNVPSSNQGEGSSNTYGAGYDPFVYDFTDMPDQLTQFQGAPNDYTYNQGYNANIPPPIDTSFQTYQGAGTSTYVGQYTQGMPSGESGHQIVLPSFIVPPPTFSASNNVIPAQSSMPHLNHLPRNISYPSDLFDKWLNEEHSMYKPGGNNNNYRCHFCTSKVLTKYELIKKHIESEKHLELLKMNKMSENPTYVANLCNENYIIQIKTTKYKCMPCNGQNIPRLKRLFLHIQSRQHKDNLISFPNRKSLVYKEKLEKGEIQQHLNNDSSDENEDWKVKAKNNDMFLDSNGKYLCNVCNKHIKNVKQNVTDHIKTIKHKKMIREKKEKDLEQGLNLFNQEIYGNQPQIGESSMQGNTFNPSEHY